MADKINAKRLTNIVNNGNFHSTTQDWAVDSKSLVGLKIENVQCIDITPLWNLLDRAEDLGFKTKMRGNKIILTMPKKAKGKQ